MRKIIGTIGATLAIVAFLATWVAPTSATFDYDRYGNRSLSATAEVQTQDAPEFGFDVSVQAARPFLPDGQDGAPAAYQDVAEADPSGGGARRE